MNAKVYIAVSDDGDGIDKVDLPHIFERFYTGKKGNTGIGLALVSEIVKSHGGDIKAYNRNGAVFEITLPKAGDCKKKRKAKRKNRCSGHQVKSLYGCEGKRFFNFNKLTADKIV